MVTGFTRQHYLELKSIRFYKSGYNANGHKFNRNIKLLIRYLFSKSNDDAFQSLELCVLGNAALSAASGEAAPSAENFWLWVLLSGMDAATDLLPLGQACGTFKGQGSMLVILWTRQRIVIDVC